MKNHFMLLMLLMLLVPGLAAAQTPIPFLLQGRLGPDTYRAAPTYVYLRYYSTVDSALVRNGRFELRGNVDAPTKGILSMKRYGGDLSDYKAVFYVEAGTLVFTSPDSLKNASVAGTPLTDAWRALWTAEEPIRQQLKGLEKEIQAATPALRPGLQARRATLARQQVRLDSAFVRAHPSSFISLTVLNPLSRDPQHAALVRALLPTLSPEVFTTPQAEALRTAIRHNLLGTTAEPIATASLQVGHQAPNFSLATPEGRQVSLTDYRGKYVLIDFWANWCGPCRQEHPNLTKAYHKYKDKNFDVLSVSLDEARDRAKWVKAIAVDQLPWTQVSDLKGWRSQAATAYSITFIPQNFLLDPAGKIIALNLRGEELQKALARLVK